MTAGRYALFGVLWGFALAMCGFGDYAEMRAMFTFSDFRLLGVFAGAVGLLLVFFAVVPNVTTPNRRPLHIRVVVGGILFGTGWALTGACPSVAFVQLGEGRLSALATIAGIAAGIAVYPLINRVLRWDTSGCGG